MSDSPIYNEIGKTYSQTRRSDPRIVERLVELLAVSPGAHLLEIGAGTGNYSLALAERGFQVTALEPSKVMRDQGHQNPNLKWVNGSAESLPFADGFFDGVFLILSMHHFSDWQKGLAEACRVAGDAPVVAFTYNAYCDCDLWLLDYFPSFLDVDRRYFPSIETLTNFSSKQLSRNLSTLSFPLPPDLIDNFLVAGWRTPERYLDPGYRAGISTFSNPALQDEIERGVKQLDADLKSGDWQKIYRRFLDMDSLDVGYMFANYWV